MKKIITTIIILAVILGGFTVMPKAASKYIKVKAATYEKYKKAYKTNAKLKKTIANQKSALDAKEKEIKRLKKELDLAKDENADIYELKSQLESAKSMNQWVWSCIKSIGITYKDKTWSVPTELPTKFIVDGVTYKVVLTEGSDE